MKERAKPGLWTELACGLLACGSAASFAIGQSGYVGMSAYPADSASLLWTALALCFWALIRYAVVARKLRLKCGFVLWGLFFGVLNVLGQLLFAYDSWAMLGEKKQLALALLRMVGQAVPMTVFMGLADDALRRNPSLTLARDVRLPACFSKHETAWVAALLILCWLPYLIAFYPGTVCWDLGEMIAQFFGQREMDTWHPVFLTWLFGGCVWLGRQIGSDNLGAALFTQIQTVTLAWAASSSLRWIRRQAVPKWVWVGSLAFFAIVPLWGGYAQFISKDTLYTAALLLFETGLLWEMTQPGEKGKRGYVQLFVWGFLSCVIRANGLYVVLGSTAIFLLSRLLRKQKLWAALAMVAAVVCGFAFHNGLVPALGIRNESTSGIYSVCFQQSARTLRDHGDTVTAEEYQAIDRVLDAERLPDLYEPWISDPVKFTFRQYGSGPEVEKAALKEYSQTWLQMLLKYPLTYAESFFAGNISYYTFQPKLEGNTYNGQAGNRLVFETYELGEDARFLHTTQPKALEKLRTLLAAFARGWRRIPIVGALYSCALYTWLLVACALSLFRQKRRQLLCAFMPALLTLGVCMLGPVNDYFRYFLPVVAMAPSLLAVSFRPNESELISINEGERLS